ncbi:MAG: nucleotidyltransferase domain-containing protein [Saprospiraceae bacterium]
MDFGLNTVQIATLREIFERYADVRQVVIYGSRAKGNYTNRSDIDFAITESKVDRHLIARILIDIDQSDFPFQVDLQDYSHIKNSSLREHIERVGKLFYQAESIASLKL